MGSNHNRTIREIKSKVDSIVGLLDKLDLEVKEEDRSHIAIADGTERENGHEYGELPYRVIHLKNNPAQMKIHAKTKELEELKKENERLRARLELLESGNDADVTRRIDDAVNNAHQIEVLSQRLSEFQKREAKILDSFRKTSREFREVCYLLTGYRVDALKDRIYRLTSMYAESEEDKLFFEIAPDGAIQLLKSEYSDRLSEHISTYLENADSFPAFLASITLELFKSTTQLTPMSMCMSTTIQPNPVYSSRRE